MLNAVFAILVCNLMPMMDCRASNLARSLFGLTDRHRRAALQGQHCHRKPKENVNEQAHCPSMVPQIKNMHQGIATYVILRRTQENLGRVRKLAWAGRYRL